MVSIVAINDCDPRMHECCGSTVPDIVFKKITYMHNVNLLT